MLSIRKAVWLLSGIMLAAGFLGAPPNALGQPRPPLDAEAIRDLAQSASDQAQSAYDNALEIAESTLEAAFDNDEPGSLFFLSREVGGTREIVKNAPYSAEAITESTQVLMDGNRIVRKSVTLLARDSAGRTRQERKSERGSVVYINDPVAKRKYVLHPGRKTATPLPQVGALPLSPPLPPHPPDGAAVPPPAASDPIEIRPGRVVVRKGDRQEVRIEVVRVGNDGSESSPTATVASLPPMPPLPPLMLHGYSLSLPYGIRGKGVSESLGSRDFDGVRADGMRTTHTIPAGAVGNEKPIALVAERWYSPGLNLVLMSSSSDPRSGVTSYRLENIRRAEPAADLFRVPADYRTRGEGRKEPGKGP